MAQAFQQYEYVNTPIGGSPIAYRKMNAFLSSIGRKTESKEENWDKETWYEVGNCAVQSFYSCDVRESQWVSILGDEKDIGTVAARVEEELLRIGGYEKKAVIIERSQPFQPRVPLSS